MCTRGVHASLASSTYGRGLPGRRSCLEPEHVLRGSPSPALWALLLRDRNSMVGPWPYTQQATTRGGGDLWPRPTIEYHSRTMRHTFRRPESLTYPSGSDTGWGDLWPRPRRRKVYRILSIILCQVMVDFYLKCSISPSFGFFSSRSPMDVK